MSSNNKCWKDLNLYIFFKQKIETSNDQIQIQIRIQNTLFQKSHPIL